MVSSRLRERVHVDLKDLKADPVTGLRYLCVVRDAFSGKIWTKLFKTKEAGPIVDWIESLIKGDVGPMEELWTDHGGEFWNDKCVAACPQLAHTRPHLLPSAGWKRCVCDGASTTT